MDKILLIAVGGAGGTVLRYLVGEWMQRTVWASVPLGTLTVNVAGCFLIGVLNVALAGPWVREEYRLALVVGLLGGFTTFSGFGWETISLLSDGQQWHGAIANVVLHNTLGLAAAWAGYRLALALGY